MVSSLLEPDLRGSIKRAVQTHRPLLHHLNADSSWLLQLPRGPTRTSCGNTRPHVTHDNDNRQWLNLLIDPWFSGSQVDYSRWFSEQWHAVPSAIQSVSHVKSLIQEIEHLSCQVSREGAPSLFSESASQQHAEAQIDVVVISHEFTDHCHEDTLRQLDPETPVFATAKAASLIRSWKHLNHVEQIHPFAGAGRNWQAQHSKGLPDWLSISRLTTDSDVGYLHSALLLAFNIDDNEPAQCVIYTPHGITPESLTPVMKADPPLQPLALLHGINEVSLVGSYINLGSRNAMKAQEVLRAKYWICTHDEIKTGKGFVGWALKIKRVEPAQVAARDGLKSTQSKNLGKEKAGLSVGEKAEYGQFIELGNGGSVVLE